MGYKKTFQVTSIDEIKNAWNEFSGATEPSLLEIKVKCGSRKDLGRPKEKPIENKNAFMNFLKG